MEGKLTNGQSEKIKRVSINTHLMKNEIEVSYSMILTGVGTLFGLGGAILGIERIVNTSNIPLGLVIIIAGGVLGYKFLKASRKAQKNSEMKLGNVYDVHRVKHH